MALDLGELAVKLKADGSQLSKGLGESRAKLADFGKGAAKLFAAGGLAAGAAFVGSTMMAIDREKIADVAAAAYGDPQTAKRAGDAAGQLYAGGWGESLQEVNDSVNAVVTSIGDMATASSGDLGKFTAKLMDVSSVMKIDVARTAQIVGQSVKSGLVKNSTEGLDLLTAALRKVPQNVREDLTDALDEYGPFMASVGIKGERAFGLLVQASQKGMYGIDKTGDAIKEFTVRVGGMDTNSTKAFKSLGINATQMARDVAAGGDKGAAAFQKTIDALLKIKDPAKQSQAALAIFGTQMEDLNISDIPKFLKSMDTSKVSMGKFKGAADDLSKTVNDNAATNIESFKRQVTTAFVDVLGNKALPFVKEASAYLATNFGPALKTAGDILTGRVVPALRDAATWVQANRGPIEVVAGIITAVFLPALVAMAIQAGVSAVATAAAWLVSQAAAIASVAIQSGQIVFMIGRMILMGVVALAAGAQVALGWLLALGPIGLIIAATVLVVALIIANWGTVKRWFGMFWNWLKGAFSDGAHYVVLMAKMGFFGPVFAIIANWSTLKRWFSAFWGWLKGAFVTGAHWVMVAARNGFLGPVVAILANWGKVKAFFAGLGGQVVGYLNGLGSRMYAAGQHIVAMLGNGMASMAHAAVQKVRDIVGEIAGLIPGSPVRSGPLRSLNNGRAGRLIVGMITDGVAKDGPKLRSALAGALDMPRTAVGRGSYGAGARGGQSWPAKLVLEFGNADSEFAKAVRKTVRIKGRGDAQVAFGGAA